jgi:NADH-quinone oxidoreductase subunit E
VIAIEDNSIDQVLRGYPGAERDALIPILQAVQARVGYLSRDAVVRIGRHLNLPASKIYGVATFYNQFRFQAQGQFHIQICRGTACHVNRSLAVLEALQRELGIEAGQTSRDGMFSLEVVACIGACGLAPVISVNGEFHAGVTTKQIPKIVNSYRKQAAHAETAEVAVRSTASAAPLQTSGEFTGR